MLVSKLLFSSAALILMASQLTGCGGSSKTADGAALIGGKPKLVSIKVVGGKSVTGAALDAMLADPKEGDYLAIDGNKFLAEYDSITAEEASEPAFTILRVTKVTGVKVDVDSFSELFTEPLNLDEAKSNGTLTDAARYDNDPDALFRKRVVDWGKKGIVTSGMRM